MATRDILEDIIVDFSPDKFVRFFREKNRSFAPRKEELAHYDDENFKDGINLGEIRFAQDEKMLICAFQASQPLSERSGKKAQYEKGKKILKDSQSDAGIFIFYDEQGNFRFSLIYANYLGKKRDWSTFRRCTYFVSSAGINKTFLQRIGEGNFVSLETIKETFSVEPVTKEFYSQLQIWYFWAMDKVQFPNDENENEDIHRAKNLIRLITRIIFIWFMKEKNLVPGTLFDKSFLDNILNYHDKSTSTFYKAILQNLFFATLNTPMKKDNPQSRIFIEDAKKSGYINDGYMQQGYYRYNRFIKDKDLFLRQFENIPFLNGGLFECLDKRAEDEIRIDCFSDNPKNEKRLKVPDELFFLENEIDVDLSKYLENGRKKKVKGLLTILKSYNFTIDENTPVDEEVALDPELLGKVFENLLASYNPDTATTARKATGSYYTPREVVEYMVTESLTAYLKTKLADESREFEEKIHSLFSYNTETNPFKNAPKVTEKIIDAIENIKILDPACGSGAFPMGILHKLVLALHKVDPDNRHWKKRVIERVPLEIREETEKSLEDKPLDYIRKLGLIEHCIYGVDIQEIAIQISKLRFFISLLVEQKPNDRKSNRDIKSLPNLETKFVSANTLIGLGKLPEELYDSELAKISKELFKIREEIFYANSRWKKINLEEKEKQLKKQLTQVIQQNIQKVNTEKIQSLKLVSDKLNRELQQIEHKQEEVETIVTTNLFGEKNIIKINKTKERISEIKRKLNSIKEKIHDFESAREEPSLIIAQKIAHFNPYDQNTSTSWFDPEWMFGITEGFDVVIGNPPYFNVSTINKEFYNYLSDHYLAIHTGYNDIVYYFIFLGIELLKEPGCCAFITSNYYLGNEYAKKLRTYLKTHASKIVNFKDHMVFEGASIHTCISISQKKAKSDEITFFEPTADEQISSSDIESALRSFVVKRADLDDNWIIADQSASSIINKLNKATILLDDISTIKKGATSGGREIFTILKSFAKENRFENELLKTSINSKDIKRYLLVDSGEYLIYVDNDTNIKKYPNIYKYLLTYQKTLSKRNEVVNGVYPWYRLERPREKEVFDANEKIVVPYRAESNMFAYDNTQGFNDGGGSYAIVMKDEKVNIKYVLALLNSKLIDWFYGFIGKPKGKVREYFNKPLALIPIKKIPLAEQQPFITLVNQILAIKQKDPQVDTSALEQQIDKMVYELYGLTPDEIAIVKGKG